MKRLFAALALAFGVSSLHAQNSSQNNIAFAYFKEPGSQCIYFAPSHDSIAVELLAWLHRERFARSGCELEANFGQPRWLCGGCTCRIPSDFSRC